MSNEVSLFDISAFDGTRMSRHQIRNEQKKYKIQTKTTTRQGFILLTLHRHDKRAHAPTHRTSAPLIRT